MGFRVRYGHMGLLQAIVLCGCGKFGNCSRTDDLGVLRALAAGTTGCWTTAGWTGGNGDDKKAGLSWDSILRSTNRRPPSLTHSVRPRTVLE